MGLLPTNHKPPMGTLVENMGEPVMSTLISIIIGVPSGLVFGFIALRIADEIANY